MPDKTRAPGPSWQLSIALLFVGVLLIVPLVVRGVGSVARTITARSHPTPGLIDVDLGSGRYFLYEWTGTSRRSGNFGFSNDRGISLTPSMVAVTGESGQAVPVSPVFSTETITKGTKIYTAAVAFDTPRAGHYTIRVAGEQPGEVLVARPIGESFRRLGRPFLVALLGGMIAALGLVLLIVGLVRRGRGGFERAAAAPAYTPYQPYAPPAPPATTLPPAAWYPDPERPGGQRYWDGHAWTDHRA
jgi:hypothetical protein